MMYFDEILVLMHFIMMLSKFQVIDYVMVLRILKASQIKIIGRATERFEEDPVRMIRASSF